MGGWGLGTGRVVMRGNTGEREEGEEDRQEDRKREGADERTRI